LLRLFHIYYIYSPVTRSKGSARVESGQDSDPVPLTREWVSWFLTAHQHN